MKSQYPHHRANHVPYQSGRRFGLRPFAFLTLLLALLIASEPLLLNHTTVSAERGNAPTDISASRSEPDRLTNTELPTVSFSSARYTVNEEVGTANITVQLSVIPNDVILVPYETSSGSATAGKDYTATSDVLVFAYTDIVSFTIDIINDEEAEEEETINLKLIHLPDNVQAGEHTEALLTITDDECTSAGLLQFSEANYNVNEHSQSGKASIEVERLCGTSGNITVDYATLEQTAKEDLDYAPVVGELHFADGQSRQQFTVPIVKDIATENDETLLLFLANPSGADAMLGTQKQATLTIVDVPSVQFDASTYSIAANGKTGRATLSLNVPAEKSVGVKYTTALQTSMINLQSAEHPSERSQNLVQSLSLAPAHQAHLPPVDPAIAAIEGEVMFQPGEVSKTIEFNLDGDLQAESFYLYLKEVSDGAKLGTPAPAKITQQTDTPEPAGNIAFSNSIYRVPENARYAYITLQRTINLSSTVAVRYHVEQGSATAGSDYVQQSGILTFTHGMATQAFKVELLDDNQSEGSEFVSLRLSGIEDNNILGAITAATLIIEDDDSSAETGKLATASPYVLPGQQQLFLATTPSVITISDTGNEQSLLLNDNGMQQDVQRDDGIATTVWDVEGQETITAMLENGSGQDTSISMQVITDPDLLILTDWSALYQEFSDTGMLLREDQDTNGMHDFFELVERVYEYAAAHRGVVVDISGAITLAHGYAVDYDRLDYGTTTAIRYQQGLLIDELIANLANQTANSFRNVAILGDDQVVPFYRVFDPSEYYGKFDPFYADYHSRERDYPDSIGGTRDTPVLEDLKQAYILSDVPYSIRSHQQVVPATWYPQLSSWESLPQPDMGIGRIFARRPANLIHSIDLHEQPLCLVAEDSQASLFVGQSSNTNIPEIVAERSQLDFFETWYTSNFTYQEAGSWTTQDFTNALAQQNLVSLVAGSTHISTTVKSKEEYIQSHDLSAIATDHPVMLVSLGDHQGLSISNYPDGDGTIQAFEETLVNALTNQGITYFGTTNTSHVYKQGPANLSEMIASLFLQLLLPEEQEQYETMGVVWQVLFPEYHIKDPALVKTRDISKHLFHVSSAYGIVLYGLPTQHIERDDCQKTSSAKVTITNSSQSVLEQNTVPSLGFTQDSYYVSEGDGAATTITLAGDSDEEISVIYSARGGSAEEKIDFTPIIGEEITYPTDSLPEVIILDDQEVGEGVEFIDLSLSGNFSGSKHATLYIEDNDTLTVTRSILTTSSPYIVQGQSLFLFAVFEPGEDSIDDEIADNVEVEIRDMRLPMNDKGNVPDIQANDGIYTAVFNPGATDIGTLVAELYIGEENVADRSFTVTSSPRMLVLTDWGALYDEFVDTGMLIEMQEDMDSDVVLEDLNNNDLHDFFELVNRIRNYAAKYQGIVVDIPAALQHEYYDDLPYEGGTTIDRYQRGLLIDQFIQTLDTQLTTKLRNIVIIGDDQVVPFYRLYDPLDYFDFPERAGESGAYDEAGNHSLERNPYLFPEIARQTATVQDLQQAYIPSDTPYSSRVFQHITQETWTDVAATKNVTPDMGIGRIFASRPYSLMQIIDRQEQEPVYLSTDNSAVEENNASAALFWGSKDVETVIDASFKETLEIWFGTRFKWLNHAANWQPQDLVQALQEDNLVSLWGHGNYNTIEISNADDSAKTYINADNLQDIRFQEPPLLTMAGCHQGLSLSHYLDSANQQQPLAAGEHPFDTVLVNPLIGEGATIFAPSGMAYSFATTAFGQSVGHMLRVSLFTKNLLVSENSTAEQSTIGEVWRRSLGEYHTSDPVLLDNDSNVMPLFHANAAYSMVLYGLPTRKVQRSGVKEAEYTITCEPSGSEPPQVQDTTLMLDMEMPRLIHQLQDDGNSSFALPHEGRYIGTHNYPPVPMLVRSVIIPDNIIVKEVNLMPSTLEFHVTSPISVQGLVAAQMMTTNGDQFAASSAYSLPEVYPQQPYKYIPPKGENRLLTIGVFPMQYRSSTKEVSLYKRMQFEVTFAQRSTQDTSSYVTINTRPPIHINQAQEQVQIHITPPSSVSSENMSLHWIMYDRAGQRLVSGVKEQVFTSNQVSANNGIDAVDCTLTFDTHGWKPGYKDMVAYIEQDTTIKGSGNATLLAKGIAVLEKDPYSIKHAYFPDELLAMELALYNQDGEPVDLEDAAQAFQVTALDSEGNSHPITPTVNGDQTAQTMGATTAQDGTYMVQIPLGTLPLGSYWIELEVEDRSRAIKGQGRWSIQIKTRGEVFLPLVSR